MESRYWYDLDQTINPLGFGCWQLAGEQTINGRPHGWGPVNEQDAIHLVHSALDHGIQFFDTAAGYGDGISEERIGKAIAGSAHRHKAVVCTKILLTNDEIASNKITTSFIESAERSLKRLKRNRIDVLLIHNPPDNINWKSFDHNALLNLKKQGTIGTFGVSSRSITGAAKVIDAGFGSCIEWVFNLLERRPVDQLFPGLRAANMNFIARSPLSRGLLTSAYIKQKPVFSEGDFRSTLPQEWINWVIDSINKLDLSDHDLNHISTIALRYCLSFEEMTVVIPGIKKSKHLVDYLEILKDEYNSMFIEKLIVKLNAETDKSYPPWT